MKVLCTCVFDNDHSVVTRHDAACAVAVAQREALDRLLTREIKKKVERVRQALVEAEAKFNEVRALRTILCGCGALHAIKDLTLRVTHFYVEPYGCTDGDYWSEGEWQFVCPSNGVFNRLLFDDYSVAYDKRKTVDVAAGPAFKRLYRGLFANLLDVYEGRTEGEWVNNYYVDRHREYFELPAKNEKSK